MPFKIVIRVQGSKDSHGLDVTFTVPFNKVQEAGAVFDIVRASFEETVREKLSSNVILEYRYYEVNGIIVGFVLFAYTPEKPKPIVVAKMMLCSCGNKKYSSVQKKFFGEVKHRHHLTHEEFNRKIHSEMDCMIHNFTKLT